MVKKITEECMEYGLAICYGNINDVILEASTMLS